METSKIETLKFPGKSRSLRLPSRPSVSDLIRPNDKTKYNLEEVIDIDQDVEYFKNKSLNLLSPKILYKTSLIDRLRKKTGLVRKYYEQTICCKDNQNQTIDILSKDACVELLKQDYNLIHSGVIVIGIKTLTRKWQGTKAFIALYDHRWLDLNKWLIGMAEADLSENFTLLYCVPNFSMKLKDFSDNIRLNIQTRGYDSYKGGDNLLICIGFLGKCMNNMSENYKINTDSVVEILGNKGLLLLKPKK